MDHSYRLEYFTFLKFPFKINVYKADSPICNDYRNGDFWGLMGTRGEIVDVIHHLSPKVPVIFLVHYALDVEISPQYGAT